MSRVQAIYFDESGFTGNNLLDPTQPVFAYAGVALDPEAAAYLHSELRSRFRLQGEEIKGQNLVQSARGKKAITWLLSECKETALVTVSNKNFGLAGKFFEYVFEPVLKHNNSLFYAVGFHRFVANLLYVLFTARMERAQQLLDDFEMLMRNKDVSSLENVFDPEGLTIDFNDPLDQILTFALCHLDKIREEIGNLSEIEGVSRWALELTATSLFWLLSLWSEHFDRMQVYCDQSKPLYENQSLFEANIGRTDRVYMKLGKQPEMALTYNLTGSIVFLDSKTSPGIQIADIISSSIAYAFKNREEDCSEEWLKIAEPMLTSICIVPDPDEIDLTKRDPLINAAILNELVNRTLEGKSLLIDMEEYIAQMRHAYMISPPQLGATESTPD
ncbi:MAG: DUF3800 domain-containing protein [Dehalococcoidia bacterium]|nr:MAG: DUF3800 domain-containing protein [Dehalococcoidia bacterium]